MFFLVFCFGRCVQLGFGTQLRALSLLLICYTHHLKNQTAGKIPQDGKGGWAGNGSRSEIPGRGVSFLSGGTIIFFLGKRLAHMDGAEKCSLGKHSGHSSPRKSRRVESNGRATRNKHLEIHNGKHIQIPRKFLKGYPGMFTFLIGRRKKTTYKRKPPQGFLSLQHFSAMFFIVQYRVVHLVDNCMLAFHTFDNHCGIIFLPDRSMSKRASKTSFQKKFKKSHLKQLQSIADQKVGVGP